MMDETRTQPRRPKRVYTCTPVAFATNAAFFARDTGLIHTRLKALGVESRCILALPHDPRDLPDPEGRVIRATLEEMKNPAWWRALDIDGVFLYSWGAPRYRKIAKAIHQAGIRLAIHLDMGCAPTLWDKTLPWFQRIARIPKSLAIEILRFTHLSYADFITASYPVWCGLKVNFIYRGLSEKFRTMPCPVVPYFHYDGTPKEPRVIAVGRWGDERQKRSRLLMPSMARLAMRCSSVEIDVYGELTEEMREWHASLPEESQTRIHLRGFVASSELPEVYNKSQIVFCPSYFESSCIAVAEGLCCGCSVVCSDIPGRMDTVMDYATSSGCGRLPAGDSPEAMADALAEELACWKAGGRDPHAIAARWQPIFHVDVLLRNIFDIPDHSAEK